ILGADHNLVGPRRNPGARVDAGAATRLNYVRAGAFENVEIASTNAVLPRLLRSELNVEFQGMGYPLAPPKRVRDHPRLHVHIFVLPGSAGAAVGKFDRNRRVEVTNELAVPGIARRGNHGRNLASIEMDHLRILRVRIAKKTFDHALGFTPLYAAPLHQKV